MEGMFAFFLESTFLGMLVWGEKKLGPKKHFAAATVWVLRANTRARHFYEMAGFARDRGARLTSVGPVALPELRYRARL